MHLRIPFSEIPEHGVRFDCTGGEWFPPEFHTGADSIYAEVQLTRKQENKIEMKGKLAARVILRCDRCLGEYRYDIASPFSFIIELAGAAGNWHVQDIECVTGDLDTIEVEEPVVDIGDVLRQQVYLALPEKKICRAECKGLCSRCGADLNEVRCVCADNTVQSPFAVLQALKKKTDD